MLANTSPTAMIVHVRFIGPSPFLDINARRFPSVQQYSTNPPGQFLQAGLSVLVEWCSGRSIVDNHDDFNIDPQTAFALLQGIVHTGSTVVQPSLISFRGFLLVLVVFFSIAARPAQARGTTPTEALALQQAAQDRTAYTLPPEKLKQAQELFRARTLLHFAGEGWGILQLVLLLALGVPARMRDIAENLTKRRWGQSFIFAFLFLLAITLLDAPLRVHGH